MTDITREELLERDAAQMLSIRLFCEEIDGLKAERDALRSENEQLREAERVGTRGPGMLALRKENDELLAKLREYEKIGYGNLLREAVSARLERDALRREVEEQRVSLDGLHGELHKFDALRAKYDALVDATKAVDESMAEIVNQYNALRREIEEAPVVYGQRTLKDTAWKIDWRFRAEPFHTHVARIVRIEEIPKEKT